MTTTLAIILNAALAAGVVTGLFLVMRTPFRLRRPRALSRAIHARPTAERELSRAA